MQSHFPEKTKPPPMEFWRFGDMFLFDIHSLPLKLKAMMQWKMTQDGPMVGFKAPGFWRSSVLSCFYFPILYFPGRFIQEHP